ncbi:ferrochelatase [Zhihengliuella flava]|uniref:Coproporphyrin III ferrochelatase n=1 Tax=Zhihengliuella flava TaxID=1285193 RepID=A0A931DAQ0_9MICC|nr:ferrochelatase [Zhihengliuella flava]MBG6085567.1 ferrochelatase [Zhihengliuella flava]
MSRAENQSTPGLGYDAVLLASFGGPEGQEDVIPFLRNVTAGRGIPDERLEEVATHYRANGGVSPINEQNRDLLAALEAEIAGREWSLPLYWGNRNWDPYIPDALQQMYDDGHRRVLMLVTSAYAGYSSCCQYREDIDKGLEATGLGEQLEIVKIPQFFHDRAFITPFQEALATGITDVRAQLAAQGESEAQPKIVFVTHSIPTAIAEAQGPEHVKEEFGTDAYSAQHLAVARTLMETVPEAAGLEHSLVFQSRSGAPSTPWLEPDINDAIEEYAEQGTRGVVVMPIGFVSDHMEVKWDLDTEAKETAGELGLAFHRAPTPGIHAAFVSGLVDIVARQLEGAAPQQQANQKVPGTWDDICCVTGCRPRLTARSAAPRREESRTGPSGA